jgi:hypothetical protein
MVIGGYDLSFLAWRGPPQCIPASAASETSCRKSKLERVKLALRSHRVGRPATSLRLKPSFIGPFDSR